jgi:hypothetical protein
MAFRRTPLGIANYPDTIVMRWLRSKTIVYHKDCIVCLDMAFQIGKLIRQKFKTRVIGNYDSKHSTLLKIFFFLLRKVDAKDSGLLNCDER